MNDAISVKCPNCGESIALTEALAAPLIDASKRKLDAELLERKQAYDKREAALRDQQAKLDRDQASVNEQVMNQLKKERDAIVIIETKKARDFLKEEMERQAQESEELKEQLKSKDVKLVESQKAEVELRKKQRELDDKLREADLAVEKRVSEQILVEREKAIKEAEEVQKLRISEREKTISDLQLQLHEAIRKSEQRSQQLQGEVQELEIESTLRAQFPTDSIEPVPKGEFGGDAVQRIVGPNAQSCGIILWESKRTKNWSNSWLPKLREDQRSAKADLAVLVSSALPDDIESFSWREGVWIVSPKMLVPVASTLRHMLIEISIARIAGIGQLSKMELVYQYLTGPMFRQRVQAIVESFSSMQEDLDKEKKVILKQWAKRESQINRVMQSTVGMYGDLQGIAGKSLHEIEGLEINLIEPNEEKDS